MKTIDLIEFLCNMHPSLLPKIQVILANNQLKNMTRSTENIVIHHLQENLNECRKYKKMV